MSVHRRRRARGRAEMIDQHVREQQRVALRIDIGASLDQVHEVCELQLERLPRMTDDRNLDDRLLAVAGLLVESGLLDMAVNRDQSAERDPLRPPDPARRSSASESCAGRFVTPTTTRSVPARTAAWPRQRPHWSSHCAARSIRSDRSRWPAVVPPDERRGRCRGSGDPTPHRYEFARRTANAERS